MAFETIIQKNAFSSTRFYIDEHQICFNDSEIQMSNVSGFSYYAQQEEKSFLNAGKLFIVHIYEKNIRKPHTLRGVFPFDGNQANVHFSEIFQNLWTYLGNRQLRELHADLLGGKEVFLNELLLVNSKGAFTSLPGLFRPKKLKYFTPWDQLQVLFPLENLTRQNDFFKVIDTSSGKKVGDYHIGNNNLRIFEAYVNRLSEYPQELEALGFVN